MTAVAAVASTCLKWKHVIVYVTAIATAVTRLPADRILRFAAHAVAKQSPNTSFLIRSCGRRGRNLLQADNRINRDTFFGRWPEKGSFPLPGKRGKIIFQRKLLFLS